MDRELSHALREIFDTILDNLCADHFTTALELAGTHTQTHTHTTSYTQHCYSCSGIQRRTYRSISTSCWLCEQKYSSH